MNLFAMSVTFSRLVLDDFQNHNLIGPQDVTDQNFLNSNALVSRTVASREFSFPNSIKGPLRYESASNNIGAGLIKYTFLSGSLSTGIAVGIDLSKNPIFNFNFSNISKSFRARLCLTDLENEEEVILVDIPFSSTKFKCVYDFSEPERNNNSFNIKRVKELDILFNYPDNNTYISDLTIDLNSIEMVPEPFSLLTMGSGVAAFVRKRRKKILNS